MREFFDRWVRTAVAGLALALVVGTPARGLAQYRLDWSAVGRSAGEDNLRGLAATDDGAILAVGRNGGGFQLEGSTLDAPGHFVTKFVDRRLVFVRALPRSPSFETNAVAVAAGAEGEIWIAGSYFGAGAFGSTVLPNASRAVAYVAKLDASGVPVLVHALTDVVSANPTDTLETAQRPQLVADGAGGVFVAVNQKDADGLLEPHEPRPRSWFAHYARTGRRFVAFTDPRILHVEGFRGPPGMPLVATGYPARIARISDTGIELVSDSAYGGFLASVWSAPTGEIVGASYDVGTPFAVTRGGSTPYGISLLGFDPSSGALRSSQQVATGDLVSIGAHLVDQAYGNALAGHVYGAGSVADVTVQDPAPSAPGTGVSLFVMPTVRGAVGAPKILPTFSGQIARLGPSALVLGGSYRRRATIDAISFPEPVAGDVWLATATIDGEGLLGVSPDRFEPEAVVPLGASAHRHWRCPQLPRDPTGGEDDCSNIFEHGLVSREADDTFTWTLSNLTLHGDGGGRIDSDEFSLVLPDISDGTLGEYHANVQPLTDRVVPGSSPPRPQPPTPLSDCKVYLRRDVPGNELYSDLATVGTLSVRVIPQGSTPLSLEQTTVDAFASQPGDLDGFAGRAAGTWSIGCPKRASERGPFPLSTLRLRVRQESVAAFGGGGYMLLVEYRIEANRGVPEWFRTLGILRSLRCPNGGAFPACFETFAGRGRFELAIPDRTRLRPEDLGIDCLVDGPDCFDLYAVDLPTGAPLRLLLNADRPIKVDLKDFAGNAIGRAVAEPSGPAEKRQRFVLEARPKPGRHFLRVSGSGARISGELGDAALTPLPAPAKPPNLEWLGLLVAGLILAVVVAIAVVAPERDQRAPRS